MKTRPKNRGGHDLEGELAKGQQERITPAIEVPRVDIEDKALDVVDATA